MITINEFLRTLFGGVSEGYLELAFIAPPETKLFGPIIGWVKLPATLSESQLGWIASMNGKGYGAYYGLTPRGVKHERVQKVSLRTGNPYYVYPRGKAHDATHVTALWADVDSTDPAALQKLQDATPSITIASGGGYHGLWLLKQPLHLDEFARHAVTRTLKGLAYHVGGDPHVAELARVFRLPQTINTKPARHGARCEVVEWIPELRYDFEDLAPFADDARRHEPLSVAVSLPDGARLDLRPWVRRYLEHGAAEGERNSTLFAAAIEYRVNGYSRADAERDLVARARADGLDEGEIVRTIESAWKSSYGQPNLPTHIKARVAAYEGGK
jgi:hypothetical protein